MGRLTLLILGLVLSVVTLPLLGVALAGKNVAPYLAFPPLTAAADHASFSWLAFVAVASLILACVAPFVVRLTTAPPGGEPEPVDTMRPVPWWGWLGLTLLVAAWVLAWNRFAWLASVQRHTFTPLWLGYVVLVNALAWRRSGRCMLTHSPWRLLALFPVSAVFWWLFEFLNRFVQNWFYVGVADLGPWTYFWQATLPFSTVLPAVLCTRDWLATFPRLSRGLRDAWPLPLVSPRGLAAAALLLAAATLVGIGVWPQHLYMFVWVSPLVLFVSLQVLFGQTTILAPLARGDWRDVWLSALAALVCGFFWELWNVNSLAHWQYAIPLVHRFEVFEMPLLGYAGYLPFGLLCIAVGQALGCASPGQRGG